MSYARSILVVVAGILSIALAAVALVAAGTLRHDGASAALLVLLFLCGSQFGALFAWRRIERCTGRFAPVAAGIELAAGVPVFFFALAVLLFLASFVFPFLAQLLWAVMLWPREWQPLHVLLGYIGVDVPVCVALCVLVTRIRREERLAESRWQKARG